MSARRPRTDSIGLDIGLAFDLKRELESRPELARGPDDRFEEYDSDATVDAVAGALSELGHRPRRMGGGRRFVEEALARPPELVFNFAEGHGTRSREAHVPAVCEMLGIPFTHSDPLTLAATLDKSVAKTIVAAAGLAVPRGAVVREARELGALDMVWPRIAKPLFEGSSMGVRRSSRVEDAAALAREVERLSNDYGEPVLVEEFLEGIEVTVGLLGNGSRARVIAAMEIAPRIDDPARFVYSLEVKRDWENQVEYHVPPRLPAATLRAIETLALSAYRALECRDVARIDVRLDRAGRPCFIEANPLPGLNPRTGDLCVLAGRAGLSFVEIVRAIVDGAVERHNLHA